MNHFVFQYLMNYCMERFVFHFYNELLTQGLPNDSLLTGKAREQLAYDSAKNGMINDLLAINEHFGNIDYDDLKKYLGEGPLLYQAAPKI